MIEIYVGLSLMGLGYILNQNRPVRSNPTKQINVNELTSAANVYDSNYLKTAKQIDTQLAKKKFVESQSSIDQKPPRVIPKTITSQLAGINIPETDFKHNNMKPFYRGSLSHDKFDNAQHVERFTGSHQYYKPKRETESFFKPEQNFSNITGMKGTTSFVQNRIEPPKVRNNTLPFQQMRVGPAINEGYTTNPTGGFNQYATREFVMPKQVDELRVLSKPKTQYEGRVIEGQKGSKVGVPGKMAKNRVPTTFEKTVDNYFYTTGAYLKDTMHPEETAKYTARQDISSKPYTGIAHKKTVGNVNRSESREPFKEQLGSFGVANVSLVHQPNQSNDDYGKASVQVYDNERSVTTTKTYQGNIVSLIKSITAPIEDLIKISKKEYTVEAPREYGNLQTTFPSKQTVYDPSQTTRTNIKETLIHDSVLMNLKGVTKLSVYDPNQTMRTTNKETMLHDSQALNLKSAATSGPAIDPDLKAKMTGRQTIDSIDTLRNIGTNVKGSIAIDKDDTARVTGKEMVDTYTHRNFGNADRGENFQGAYEQEVYSVPDTQRHIFAQQEYSGNPGRQAGDGYTVVEDSFVPLPTQKQAITNSSEYYGGAGDKVTQKTMSYEDAYNATFNELRQEMLQKRDPTLSSVKVFKGVEDVVMATRKMDCDNDAPRSTQNHDRITNVPLDAATNVQLTRQRNDYEEDDRLDIDILEAFKNNEFTQALDSVA